MTPGAPVAAAPSGKLTLVLLAATLALAYGIWYAYSVILVALLETFGWNRSTVAGAFSVFAVVHGCFNPVVGNICDRVKPPLLVAVGSVGLALAMFACSTIHAPWQLYLYFGVLGAVSTAACGWIPAVVQVQRRFSHRLGFALGIVSSGVGVGMLVVVPLVQSLIELWDWRFAFQVLGVLSLLVILPAAIFLYRAPLQAPHSRASGSGADTVGGAGVTLSQAARTLPFWLMVAAFFFGSMCSQTVQVHQVAFLVDHDMPALLAASVVSVVGIASIAGKTGGGWLSDRFEREVIFMVGIGILVASVVVLFQVGRHTSLAGAYTYAVMIGIGYSATAAIVPAMVSDRFNGPSFGAILGIGLFGSATGSAFGPWMAGYLFDRTGSYEIPFTIAAFCGLGAGLAGWLARASRRARAGASNADGWPA